MDTDAVRAFMQLKDDALAHVATLTAAAAALRNGETDVPNAVPAARAARAILQAMRDGANDGFGCSSDHVYAMHYQRVAKQVLDAIFEYHAAKTQARNASAADLRRRAQLVYPDRNFDDVDDGAVASTIAAALRADPTVQVVYTDVQSRAQEVQALSTSIVELRDMFADMNALLSLQHEALVSIEDTVETAAVRVQSGNAQLREAIRLQKRARKRCCCIATVVIVAVAVVVAVTAGVVTNVSL
jgi:t-SNARE complex subunit (syntaxin)